MCLSLCEQTKCANADLCACASHQFIWNAGIFCHCFIAHWLHNKRQRDKDHNCLCTACIIIELLLVSFPLVSNLFFWGKCQCQYICTNVDVNRAVTAIYDLTKLQRARQKCQSQWQQNTLITLCCTTWIHSPRTTSRLHNLFGHTGLQDVPTKVLSECCWNHSALAQSQVAGTPCVWKLIFWSFLTKTKPDQAFPSHVHGKI